MASQEHTVKDALGAPVTFTGKIIAHVGHDNTAPGAHTLPRWTDMTLFRVTEPNSTYRYAVHIAIRTVVYHRNVTPCPERKKTRWVRMTVKELDASDPARYQQLIACRRPGCRPDDLDDLPDSEIIAMESDDYRLVPAATPKDVIRAFYQHSGGINSLAADLLREAAEHDNGIRRALTEPRRLGE